MCAWIDEKLITRKLWTNKFQILLFFYFYFFSSKLLSCILKISSKQCTACGTGTWQHTNCLYVAKQIGHCTLTVMKTVAEAENERSKNCWWKSRFIDCIWIQYYLIICSFCSSCINFWRNTELQWTPYLKIRSSMKSLPTYRRQSYYSLAKSHTYVQFFFDWYKANVSTLLFKNLVSLHWSFYAIAFKIKIKYNINVFNELYKNLHLTSFRDVVWKLNISAILVRNYFRTII